MSIQGSIHRYFLIVEKVQRNQLPSFNAISIYLKEHGFEISDRTLQRDIDALRIEFNIDICYDRIKNGYLIDKSDTRTESAIRFLEIATEAEIVLESFKDVQKTLSEISFENTGILKGIGHLRPLLFAIRYRRLIEFDHNNFNTDEQKKYFANPYLLKEYQGRWYIYAKIDKLPQPLLFGIDRIENLVVTSSVYKPVEIDLKGFDNVVGISLSNEPALDIVLEFTSLQGKYIKALPIHSSQVIIKEDEDHLTVKIQVVPNFELKQKILMYGDSVVVIEPQALAREIQQIHKKSAEQYRQRHGLS